jgi:broad specificity phosphatase PhoE
MAITELILVRHGESAGNVAAHEAERTGAHRIAVPDRDADVPLTPLGVEQAAAVGTRLAGLAPTDHPDIVFSSPFRRAHETAVVALRAAAMDADGLRPLVDERLRDRDLGILDTLTSLGVDAEFPDEAARRRFLGKFYYRPPGGESWTDVALRIRSFLRDLPGPHARPGGLPRRRDLALPLRVRGVGRTPRPRGGGVAPHPERLVHPPGPRRSGLAGSGGERDRPSAAGAGRGHRARGGA